ncbi:MAG: hypothetical protein K9N35_06115 [Candidatus Marinimicrobia bacterium]|nr:hypothetical protein [Candidatus Neomarinimicrobiota bacterium]
MVFALSLAPIIVHGQFFYTGKSYGSEALFNPVSVVLNNGYDIIQLGNRERTIFDYPYKDASANVWRSVSHPLKTISAYGTQKFITSELFPLKFSIKHVQWWPNYNVHLIGGGMTYRMLIDWYKFYDYPKPVLLSIVTVGAFHFLNEVVENYYFKDYNGDAVADLLFFDIAGVLLFSNDRVARFFRKRLNLSDWSMQPSIRFSDKSLHNNGQYWTIKWDLPKTVKWQLFYTFGMDGLVGLSYKLDPENTISMGGGFIGKELIDVDEERNIKTVKLVWSTGIFYDRNNSLLASLKISGHIDYPVLFNVFPGVLKVGAFSPGLWTAVNKDGGFIFGLTSRWTPGIVIG